MNVGLDTSVVLRLLTGQPEEQAMQALGEVQRLSADGVSLCVSDLVVAEAYFALQHYCGMPKKDALGVMCDFLDDGGIVNTGTAVTVLATAELTSAKPGFVDRMIYADYLRSAQEVLTFEKAGSKLPSVRLLGVY